MRSTQILAVAALAAACAVSVDAQARPGGDRPGAGHHRGGHGGHQHHGNRHGHFHGHRHGHPHHWRGHWRAGFHYPLAIGIGLGATYPWWGYYGYYYPYPRYAYPYPAGVVVERHDPPHDAAPPVTSPEAFRWYCPPSGGYYPDVRECADTWLKVLPPDRGPSAPPRS